MSTKIYNGYKLPLLTATSLAQFNKKLQKQFVEARVKMIRRIYGDQYHRYWWDLTKRNMEVKKTGLSDPYADFSAEIVYFPLIRSILAITFWERGHTEYTEIWESHKHVQYHGYWNNVDPDSRCTAHQWAQRRRDWEKVFGPEWKPVSECGFAFKLLGDFIPWPDQVYTEEEMAVIREIRKEEKEKREAEEAKAEEVKSIEGEIGGTEIHEGAVDCDPIKIWNESIPDDISWT